MEHSYNVTILSFLRRKNFNQSEGIISPSTHVEFLNGTKTIKMLRTIKTIEKIKVMDNKQWTQIK